MLPYMNLNSFVADIIHNSRQLERAGSDSQYNFRRLGHKSARRGQGGIFSMAPGSPAVES